MKNPYTKLIKLINVLNLQNEIQLMHFIKDNHIKQMTYDELIHLITYTQKHNAFKMEHFKLLEKQYIQNQLKKLLDYSIQCNLKNVLQNKKITFSINDDFNYSDILKLKKSIQNQAIN